LGLVFKKRAHIVCAFMKGWQKHPSHQLNWRKQGRVGTEILCANMVKGAVSLIVQVKIDSHTILLFIDRSGLLQFVWPKSMIHLLLDKELLAKLREECAGLDGILVFELCSKRSAHTHTFLGLSGLCRKDPLSICDWHLWNLTLVILTSDEGADANERISVVETLCGGEGEHSRQQRLGVGLRSRPRQRQPHHVSGHVMAHHGAHNGGQPDAHQTPAEPAQLAPRRGARVPSAVHAD